MNLHIGKKKLVELLSTGHLALDQIKLVNPSEKTVLHQILLESLSNEKQSND